MKLLVVGANGQVGSELCLLDSSECRIVGLGREELNIINAKQVDRVITEQQPDFVINAAAFTAVDKAEQEIEQAYAINRDGPHNLAIACHAKNIPLLHISTDYVFAGDASTPYREADVTQPINIYGKSKLAGEELIREVCTDHIILRTSWVFGYYGNNFVKTMLRLGQQRNELSIVSDQQGCPTAAKDIATTIVAMCQTIIASQKKELLWGTYHYTGTPATTWYDFAQAIFTVAKQNGISTATIMPIPTSDYPTPATRPRYTALDCQKIEHHFGIRLPAWQISLEKVVTAIINHLKNKAIEHDNGADNKV